METFNMEKLLRDAERASNQGRSPDLEQLAGADATHDYPAAASTPRPDRPPAPVPRTAQPAQTVEIASVAPGRTVAPDQPVAPGEAAAPPEMPEDDPLPEEPHGPDPVVTPPSTAASKDPFTDPDVLRVEPRLTTSSQPAPKSGFSGKLQAFAAAARARKSSAKTPGTTPGSRKPVVLPQQAHRRKRKVILLALLGIGALAVVGYMDHEATLTAQKGVQSVLRHPSETPRQEATQQVLSTLGAPVPHSLTQPVAAVQPLSPLKPPTPETKHTTPAVPSGSSPSTLDAQMAELVGQETPVNPNVPVRKLPSSVFTQTPGDVSGSQGMGAITPLSDNSGYTAPVIPPHPPIGATIPGSGQMHGALKLLPASLRPRPKTPVSPFAHTAVVAVVAGVHTLPWSLLKTRATPYGRAAFLDPRGFPSRGAWFTAGAHLPQGWLVNQVHRYTASLVTPNGRVAQLMVRGHYAPAS